MDAFPGLCGVITDTNSDVSFIVYISNDSKLGLEIIYVRSTIHSYLLYRTSSRIQGYFFEFFPDFNKEFLDIHIGFLCNFCI